MDGCRRVLAHGDTGNISVGIILFIICIGPPTTVPHKSLVNITDDEQKKKRSLQIFQKWVGFYLSFTLPVMTQYACMGGIQDWVLSIEGWVNEISDFGK